MPRGDGSGPSGQGPMTGRGMGYCAGYSSPGFNNPGPGYSGRGLGFGGPTSVNLRGAGRGRGMGMASRGFRGWGMPVNSYTQQPISQTDEKKVLEDQKEILQEELDLLKERIAQLEKDTKDQS